VKYRIAAVLAVAGLMLTTGCGGNGGVTPGTPAPKPPVTQKANAKGTLTMTIPLGNGPLSRGTMALGSRHPMFVDGNTNGSIDIVFDGTNVPIDFAPNGNTATPGPSATPAPLSNGGSVSYTSTVGYANGTNQLVATITATYTTIPGPNTVGVVQLNGACDVAPDPCLSANDGYVLSEGQTTLNLAPGSNGASTLFLKGVMQSAYLLCHATGCSGLGTPNADGSYDIDAVAADENGTAITDQLTDPSDPTSHLTFDNGSYQLVALTPGIVTFSNNGPFNTPGTDRHSTYGHTVNIKCSGVGATTIEAQIVSGSTGASTVTGFVNPIESSGDYPAATAFLGSVGSDQYFGGSINVNCTATGSMTIQ